MHWVENIAKPTIRPKAYGAYRTAVYRHLILGIGKHRVDKIEAEHFEKLYSKMLATGLKPGTAHQVHRTAKTAWGEAHRRAHVVTNPMDLVKAPRVEEEEIEPFETEEIQALIKAALNRRNGVRLVIALALGTRKGETIGLKWAKLKKSTKRPHITSQVQRHTWEHGCEDPRKCGARYHKTEPCKDLCRRHTRACPPPCPPNCVDHARNCPKRRGGGLVEVDVKSRAGRRGIVLPDHLYDLLLAHEAQQAAERDVAGTAWEEGGWMFTQPNGRQISPEQDAREWKALLEAAGVRDARLHDARHTAATVLLLLGIPWRAVMDVMGWSNTSMAKRYQHVTGVLREQIAQQLNGFLWNTE